MWWFYSVRHFPWPYFAITAILHHLCPEGVVRGMPSHCLHFLFWIGAHQDDVNTDETISLFGLFSFAVELTTAKQNCQLVDDGYYELGPPTAGSSVHSTQSRNLRDQDQQISIGRGVDYGDIPSEGHEEPQKRDSLVRLDMERQSPDPSPLHQASSPNPSTPPSDAHSHVASPVAAESLSSPLADEPSGDGPHEPAEPPLLPVHVFRPLLINLLLTATAVIGEDTRSAIVELLRRLRGGHDLEEGAAGHQLGQAERDMLEHEMIYGIVLGLARMDSPDASENGIGRLVGARTDSDSTAASQNARITAETGSDNRPIPVNASDLHTQTSDLPEFPIPPEASRMSSSASSVQASPALELTSRPEDGPELSGPVEIVIELPSPGARDEEESLPSGTTAPAERSQLDFPFSAPSQSHIQRDLPNTAAISNFTLDPPEEPLSPPEPRTPIQASRTLPEPSPSPFTIPPSPSILASPSTMTPQTLYLSPLPSSMITPNTLMSQLIRSPGRSAPHTPPSPSMRLVHLPSAENTPYINIPRTPFGGLSGHLLGLENTSSPDIGRLSFSRIPTLFDSGDISAPTSPPFPALDLTQMPLRLDPDSPGSEEATIAALTPPPLSPLSLPSVDRSPSPSKSLAPTQWIEARAEPQASSSHLGVPLAAVTQPGYNFSPELLSFGRRPSASPVQPTSSGSSGKTTTPKQESSRTKSYSSEKSSSTPTEGSSNDTVTPSASPIASPTTELVSERVEAIESFPNFRSVPVLPVHQDSLSPSSSTTASTSTGGTGASRSSSTLDSSSSWPSTSDTPSSATDSEAIRTPESPKQQPSPLPPAGTLSSKEPTPELTENPYFPHTRAGEYLPETSHPRAPEVLTRVEEKKGLPSQGGDAVPKESRRANLPALPVASQSVLAAASSSTSDLPLPLNLQSAGYEVVQEEPTSEIGIVPFLNSASTPATPPAAQPIRSPSHSVSPPLGRSRSRSTSRPENLPLPQPSLDSPYPSPPTEAPFPVQIGFDALLSDDLNTRLVPQSGSIPEVGIDEEASSPRVRLPGNLDTSDPGPTSDGSQRAHPLSETNWAQQEGDVLVEGAGDSSEDAAIGRVASMSLIAAVTAAGVLNEETIQMFTDEVVRVGKNSIYWVRREAAYALGALAKVAPIDILRVSLVSSRK